MEFINISLEEIVNMGETRREEYASALPFPHICFQNFFNTSVLRNILEEFPELGGEKQDVFYANPNEKKYASKGEYRFGKNTKEFMHFLNSQPFLEFLQKLTGIKETLIPDPYFEGGGCHQIKQGGFLKLHVDFHQHREMKLDRRINVLVYLNEDWKEEYGGYFELWEKDMSKCATKFAPLFNRMVIFSTTDFSWHGHPDPLTCPTDRSRKSLALYYYTNGRPDNEINWENRKRITTTFASREKEDTLKMKIFNNIVNIANDWMPPVVVRIIKKFKKG